MNRKISFLLAGTLCVSLLLTACGEPQGDVSPSPTEPSPPASTQPVQSPSDPAEGTITTPSQQPSGEPVPSDSDVQPSAPSAEETKELALTFIDKSVEDLIAAIGEPTGSDYAPSCLGSGEDGELFYDGFSVYTYREGDIETVKDVL